MNNEAKPVSRPWRRYLRFSVRGLIVLVLVIGVWLGWLVRSARIQHDAVAEIEKSRGRVWYHWQKTGGAVPNPAEKPSWPKWLVDCLGVDYLGHITQVVAGHRASDSILARIGDLGRLEDLAVNGNFTNAGVSGLQSLRDLRILVLTSPNVTDAGLVQLQGLTNLSELYLRDTQVTDAGVKDLQQALPSLKIIR